MIVILYSRIGNPHEKLINTTVKHYLDYITQFLLNYNFQANIEVEIKWKLEDTSSMISL